MRKGNESQAKRQRIIGAEANRIATATRLRRAMAVQSASIAALRAARLQCEFSLGGFKGGISLFEKEISLPCWVSVKQFSKNDTATACQDWLRSTRLGRGSIKSHVRTVKVLGMGLFAFQERIHLWKGVTH